MNTQIAKENNINSILAILNTDIMINVNQYACNIRNFYEEISICIAVVNRVDYESTEIVLALFYSISFINIAHIRCIHTAYPRYSIFLLFN